MKKNEKTVIYGVIIIVVLFALYSLGVFKAVGIPLSLTAQTIPVGTAWSYLVSLSGVPAPLTNPNTGFLTNVSCSSFIVDSTGNYQFQGTVVSQPPAATTFEQTVSFTPSASGVFEYGAVCLSVNNTYANGQWQGWTSPPIIVAHDEATVTASLTGAPPPTVPFWTSLGSYISSFLGNLVCAFKQLIGQTC